MKQNIIIGFVVGVLVASVYFSVRVTSLSLGNISRNPDGFSVATTVSSTSVATATTQVLARNTDRSYARIDNDGANQVWCRLGTATATAGTGFAINPSNSSTLTSVEFGVNHIPYFGAVQCVAETAATAVTITEN